MSYVKRQISVYGIERNFMEVFINELTNADNRIICETDIDYIYNNPSLNMPIKLKINNSYYIYIQPQYTAGYNMINAIQVLINNETYFNSNFTTSTNTYVSYTNKATRILNFTVVSNDNIVYIVIGDIYPSNKVGILSVDYDTFVATAVNSTNIVCTDEIHKNQSISLVNRLAYQDDGIDITNTIDSKVFVDTSSNIKFAEVTTGLIDCSYMTSPNIISTDSGKFFTLNNYTLMPIKE